MQIIGLDSLIEGQAGGEVGAEQLAWLDGVLRRDPDRPTLLAIHHPPVMTRVGSMDGIGLADRAALGEVVSAHGNIKAIIAGHIHRTLVKFWCGVPVITAPSPVNAVAFSLTPVEVPVWEKDAAGFFLHHFMPDGELTSYLVPLGGAKLTGRFRDPHGPLSA